MERQRVGEVAHHVEFGAAAQQPVDLGLDEFPPCRHRRRREQRRDRAAQARVVRSVEQQEHPQNRADGRQRDRRQRRLQEDR